MFHLCLLATLALIVVHAMYKVHMQAQGAPILSAHALIKVVVPLVWNSSGSSRGTEGVMPPGPVKISHKKDYHSCFSSPPLTRQLDLLLWNIRTLHYESLITERMLRISGT